MDLENIKKSVAGFISEISENPETLDLSNSEIEDLTFDEMNIDSILFIRLVVMCESSFGIQFEDEFLLMSKYENIGEFIKYILSLYSNKENN